MSEQLAVRDSDLVMRELAQTKASVIEAQRVLLVGAGAIPKLLGELNDSLAELGYVCVPIEPAQGLYKTFADLLACPSLAPLLESTELVQVVADDRPQSPVAAEPDPQQLDEDPSVSERQIRALERSLAGAVSSDVTVLAVTNAKPCAVVVPKLDMTKPVNWKLGDVFQDNPRITLPHKCCKWLLDSLSGTDVEIRSPNTTTTELLSLTQFMARYVFHSRPIVEQSAAE